MTAPRYAAKLAAYQSASAHGGVAAADPHKLILMLMDGAIDRISAARGCIERRDTSEKARLISRAMAIVAELRGCLNLKGGGSIAANLSELYDFVGRRLLAAQAEDNLAHLDDASRVLGDIRGAWSTIPQQLARR
jgi:flagellar protein FliS